MAKVLVAEKSYFRDNVSSMEEILWAAYSLIGVLKVHSELGEFFTTHHLGSP